MARFYTLCMLAYLAAGSVVLGRTTTCFAPPATLGEKAQLTCNFGVDVKTLTPIPSFNVRRGDHEDFNFNRDTVLDCDWLEGQQYCTTIKDGYSYDKRVSDHLVVIIDNVTMEHAGTYYCQLAHTGGPGSIEGCKLTVTERAVPKPTSQWARPSTTSATEAPAEMLSAKAGGVDVLPIILPIIGGVVLIVAIVVVVYMLKRRKSRNSTEKIEQGNEEGDKEKWKLDHSPVLEDRTELLPGDVVQPTDSFGDETESRPMLQTAPLECETLSGDRREESTTNREETNPEPELEPQPEPEWELQPQPSPRQSPDTTGASFGPISEVEDDDNDEDDNNDKRDSGDEIEGKLCRADNAAPEGLRMAKPVAKEIRALKAAGTYPLQPVPDEYKRASAQRDPKTWIKPRVKKRH